MKTLKFDIHSHTTKSDGYLTEDENARFFVENGYSFFGPADHHYLHIKYLEKHGYNRDQMTLAYYKLDSTKIRDNAQPGDTISYVPVCEFTVRDENIKNFKDNPAKFHLLCISPVLTDQIELLDIHHKDNKIDIPKNNSALELLNIKRQESIDYALAPIEYPYRLNGIQYPAKLVNKFIDYKRGQGVEIDRITPELATEFFSKYPEELKKLGYSKKYLSKVLRNIPLSKRINMSLKTTTQAFHANGAIVVVAHLLRNLVRIPQPAHAVRQLILDGVDGLNLMECDPKDYPPSFKGVLINDYMQLKAELKLKELTKLKLEDEEKQKILEAYNDALDNLCESLWDKDVNDIIKHIAQETPHVNELIFDGGGCDAHTYEDYDLVKHGKFTSSKCPVFMQELYKLQKYREMGCLTHRIYPDIDQEKIQKLIDDHTPAQEIVVESTGKSVIKYNRNTQFGKFADVTITMVNKDKLVAKVKKAIAEGKDPSRGIRAGKIIVPAQWVSVILNQNITSDDYKKIIAGEIPVPKGEAFKEDKRRPVTKVARRYFDDRII